MKKTILTTLAAAMFSSATLATNGVAGIGAEAAPASDHWSTFASDFENSFPKENNTIKHVAREDFKRTLYVDATAGKDSNRGTSASAPLKTLSALEALSLKPGDRVLLKGGATYRGTIELVDLNKKGDAPILIGSYGEGKALIDFAGYPAGVKIENTSNVTVADLKLTANGGPASTGYMLREGDEAERYRYGVFVNSVGSKMKGITIFNVDMRDIYYYNEGDKNTPTHIRPCRMWSTNGEAEYGWGIRALSRSKVGGGGIDGLTIKDCHIKDVSHTGIKVNGTRETPISNVLIEGCTILDAGGPGSQFGGVFDAVMRRCKTVNSGSRSEPRKWGRGSGMWTHTCENFIFEHNLFQNAQGIADCCGGHIDIGCKDVVMQYNLSKDNAGGFVEILGRNQNCSYRYNISINDGWRNPTDNAQDAFWQWEAKAVDAQGNDMRKIIGKYGCLITVNGHTNKFFEGPFQSYIYNNTIVCSADRKDRFTNGFIFEIASSAEGVLVANNIFWVPQQMKYSGSARFYKEGDLIDKAYDLRKPTGETDGDGKPVVRDLTASEIDALDHVISNNLYQLYDPQHPQGENALPYNTEVAESKNRYYDKHALGGDPGFRKNANWERAEDLIPSAASVVNRGIAIPKLSSDKSEQGLIQGLQLSKDFFGNTITTPIVGACVAE